MSLMPPLRPKFLQRAKIFADNLPENLRDAVEQFEQDSYTASASLQDNILFGKLAYWSRPRY